MAQFSIGDTNAGSTSFIDGQQLLTMKMQPHFLTQNYSPPQAAKSILDQHINAHVMVVSASPGYGKSALAAYWQRKLDAQLAWLTLGGTENDPLRLLRYLIGSLSQVEPYGWPKAEQMLVNGQLNIQPLLERLKLEEKPFAFVIDGLNQISDERSLQLLWQWIESTLNTGKFRYCITSRRSFELPSRVLLNHPSIVLEQQHLALSAMDIQQMLKRMESNYHPSQGLCWELSFVTEGHPAIIRLWLKDAIQHNWTQALSPQLILSSSVRRFLKDIGLDRKEALFQQGWDQQGHVHKIARAWFKQLDIKLDADGRVHPIQQQIETALQTHQPRVALQKIEDNIEILLSFCDFDRYLKWLDQLDIEVIKKSPWALAFFSWIAGFSGWLEKAGNLMASAPFVRDAPALSHLWLTLRAVIARAKGETANAIKLCQDAQNIEQALPVLKIYNLIALGNAFMAEYRVLDAEKAFTEALEIAKYEELNEMQALALYYRARLAQCQGQLQSANRFLSASEGIVNGLAYDCPMIAGRVGMYRGYLYWLQGYHAQAERATQTSLTLITQTRDPYALQGYVILAALYRSQGAIDSARFVLDRIEGLLQHWKVSGVIYKYWLQGMKALLLLDENKLSLAKPTLDNLYQLSKQRDGLPTPESFPQMAGFIELSYARLKANLGRLKEAVKILDHWVEHFEATGLGFNQVLVKTLRAQLRYQLGLRDLAVADLKQALATAEKEFCAMPFVELGEDAVHLAKQLVPNQKWEEMLDVLVGKAKEDMDKRSEETKTCTISNRELRVLKLMAEGMSNQEIAESLYISLNTVKTHARRINTKLSVKNRTQAILKAQKLAIL